MHQLRLGEEELLTLCYFKLEQYGGTFSKCDKENTSGNTKHRTFYFSAAGSISVCFLVAGDNCPNPDSFRTFSPETAVFFTAQLILCTLELFRLNVKRRASTDYCLYWLANVHIFNLDWKTNIFLFCALMLIISLELTGADRGAETSV